VKEKTMKVLLLISLMILASCVMEDSSPRAGKTFVATAKATVAPIDSNKKIEETRPTNQIFIKRDFCVCLKAKPDALGNCNSFCATKSADKTDAILYGSVTLSADLNLNEKFNNLDKWCKATVNNVEGACRLQLTNESGSSFLNFTTTPGSNSFSAILTGAVDYNKTYAVKILEQNSVAVSDNIQVRRKKYTDTVSASGSLKIVPTSMYSCISRSACVGPTQGDISCPALGTTNDFAFLNAARSHFFFASNSKPPAVPASETAFFCHDIILNGIIDSSLFDRLELIPTHFLVWDQSDIRFYDQDSTNKLDVNEIIEKRLLEEYSVSKTINLFAELKWPNSLSAGANNTPRMGYFMQPWIDQQSGLGFCPTEQHYLSNDGLFRILGEVVGTKTEGIYLAERDPEVIVGADGKAVTVPTDIMIVREGLLKRIWFYRESNQFFEPTEQTATQKTIQFFWPADTVNPFVKKSTQRLYTIKRPEDIGAGSTSTAIPTSVRPPDKRFGCVPALD
jgi:hypothetical protein